MKEARVWAKVDKDGPGGCWLFTGKPNHNGYGRMSYDGRQQMVHRIVWQLCGRDLSDGYELDHLCRVPACCNPDHLEAVPHRTNVLRGDGPTAANAAKTHCPKGHELTATNTYRRDGLWRECRICRNARAREAEKKRGRRERVRDQRTDGVGRGQVWACPTCGERTGCDHGEREAMNAGLAAAIRRRVNG